MTSLILFRRGFLVQQLVTIHQNLYHSCFSDLAFPFTSVFKPMKLTYCIAGFSALTPPMTPKDEWSDSDDDVLSKVETSVLLGVPDGVADEADINDAAVSRIGGHPVRCILYCFIACSLTRVEIKAFLPSQEPSSSSASCKSCSNPMELLVQIWCPVEDSPHDRALYIWGCARGSCQKKDGR
jgi:hypothetical protein